MSEKEKEKKEKEKVKNTEEKPVKKAVRKRKKKEEETPVTFPETFAVVGADLSLRRPGFTILLVHQGKIIDVMTKSIDKKTSKEPRSQILTEIFASMPVIKVKDIPVYYVREKAFNGRGAMAEIGIFEVVGAMDVALWLAYKQEWQEIYPVTVKKLLTGDGRATKEKVAECLVKYLGEREYANDDESDAAAVAVAFLIQNKAIGDEPIEQATEQ